MLTCNDWKEDFHMGLFDRFKKSDGSQCPYCEAKDISPATPEQAAKISGHGEKYICNYCGKVFEVKQKN